MAAPIRQARTQDVMKLSKKPGKATIRKASKLSKKRENLLNKLKMEQETMKKLAKERLKRCIKKNKNKSFSNWEDMRKCLRKVPSNGCDSKKPQPSKRKNKVTSREKDVEIFQAKEAMDILSQL